MKKFSPTRRPFRPAEEGYILLAVIFMLALLMISLAIAAPKVAKEIQRDRELETMHRGKQYIRAIKVYYKKFGSFPPSVDALVKTQEIRFLRKKYIDPTTGKEDWKIIRFGQAKTQTLGFFGQPITGAGSAGGSVLAGTGPSGGNSTSSGIGGGSSAFGGSSSGIGNSNSLFGSSSIGSNTLGSSTSGTASAGTGSSSDSNQASGSTNTGLSGQSFGGAGIIGFSPNSPKQSILVYKKKNHYNEWEFIYDPLTDMTTVSGNAGAIGQPAGSSAIGSGPTSTSSTTPTPTTPAPTPTAPTTPQQ